MITCSDDILLRSFLRHRTSRNGNPRHSPGGARTLMIFVLFVFVFFSRSFLNKESNEPNSTSCPTDHTLLRPRRKTLCHDYREQNVQYI